MGVVANRQLAARRREASRRIDRIVREAERRRPDVAERQARVRAATRAGRTAVKSRQEAQVRLTEALRRLTRDGLSIREAAERVGVTCHEARQLIRAAEVAERRLEPTQDDGLDGPPARSRGCPGTVLITSSRYRRYAPHPQIYGPTVSGEEW